MSEPCYESIKAQGCQFGFFKPDFYWNSGFFQSTWLFLIFKKFFFSRKGLALAKHCLSCILITNLFKRECMAMQGVKKTAKILLLPWKCSMYFIKSKCTSVITGKENTSKAWNCIISMFLTNFNICFVFVHTCFMRMCLKTAVWHFLTFCGTRSVFFGEDKFATLSKQQTFSFIVCRCRQGVM